MLGSQEVALKLPKNLIASSMRGSLAANRPTWATTLTHLLDGWTTRSSVGGLFDDSFKEMYQQVIELWETTEMNNARFVEAQGSNWWTRLTMHHILQRLWRSKTVSRCDALAGLLIPLKIDPKEEAAFNSFTFATLAKTKEAAPNHFSRIMNTPRDAPLNTRDEAARALPELKKIVTVGQSGQSGDVSSSRTALRVPAIDRIKNFARRDTASRRAEDEGEPIQHPYLLSETWYRGQAPRSSSEGKSETDSDDTKYLVLPVLVAEWKAESVTREAAVNQHRMNHAAATRFLESLGITNFPVFGLISDGPRCTLDYSFVDGSESEVRITIPFS